MPYPPPSIPVPDHYTSTFKYFLSVCVCTLRAEQIKKTKTILRDYICDIDGVYRRLSTAKKTGKQFKHENFLRHRLLQTPGEENSKRKKDDFPPAIGENYINKMFLFFNILLMDVFTYR